MSATNGHEEVPTIDVVPVLRLRLPRPRSSTGISRDIPYVLRGRDEEFSRVAATLTNPAATNFVVEGPPGTGKTALVKAIGAYAAKCGYTALHLDASKISVPYQVAEQLWTLFDPNGIPQSAHRSFALHVGLPEVGAVGGQYGHNSKVNAITDLKHYLNECYKKYGTEKQQTKGFLLIFDNAATWRSATDENHDNHLPLKALCNELNDGVRDVPYPITTIFAGTPGTVSTIRKLTSNRLDPKSYLHLRGVSTLACQQIITDHLRVHNAKSTPLIPPGCIPIEAMQPIVRLCDGNVWHATMIGQELQEQLLARRSAPMESAEYLAHARHARDLVYEELSQRLTNIQSDGDNKSEPETAEHSVEKNGATFAYLAAAAQAQENRLATHHAEELLKEANEQLQNHLSMRKLIQEGLIESRTKDNKYVHLDPGSPQPKHYHVPIPSFCDYILGEYPDHDDKRTATVLEHVARMPPIPAWRWREADWITPFIEAPTILSKQHIPGNAPRLLDAVPGDQPEPQTIATP